MKVRMGIDTLTGDARSLAERSLVGVAPDQCPLRLGDALRPPADASRGILFAVTGPWSALTAQTVAHSEASDPAGRYGDAMLPDPLKLPATLGLPGNARAYAP